MDGVYRPPSLLLLLLLLLLVGGRFCSVEVARLYWRLLSFLCAFGVDCAIKRHRYLPVSSEPFTIGVGSLYSRIMVTGKTVALRSHFYRDVLCAISFSC